MSIPNVLLADDDTEFLAVTSERLGDRGLNVLSATDGEEVLQIMKRMQIDVVVLDVVMPGMDGIQILSEIKKRHANTEVIMLSGLADLETVVDGMRLGAFDYLIKPVPIERLLYRIQDAHKRNDLKILRGNS